MKPSIEMNLFENLHSFKVVEASDFISFLVFLLYNLFLFLSHSPYRQFIGIPMGTNVRSIWLIFISFPMSLIS